MPSRNSSRVASGRSRTGWSGSRRLLDAGNLRDDARLLRPAVDGTYEDGERNGLRHDGGCGRPPRRSGRHRGPAVRPPETVVAMAFRRPLQPATSSACSFDSTRTERTASTCSAGRNSSACSSTATGATSSATAVGDPSGPTPSTRRYGKRTSSPSWTTGRSSTRSRRSQRRILERQAAPARPTSRRRCRPRLGGFLNDDARAARRWLLTDPMARSQTGPRDR